MIAESQENDLRKACFNIATNLMWEKDSLTAEKVDGNIAELTEMTEKFMESATFYVEQVKLLYPERYDHYEVVCKAIEYMDIVFVIPPLRGNYDWFEYTLGTLIELARPQGSLSDETDRFLNDLEFGISIYRKNKN